MDQIPSWIIPAATLSGSFVGGVLGGYIAKRGEIRAIHAELDKVVAQNAAITKATEDIKASISTEAWSRQLRKDACFEMLKTIPNLTEALSNMVRASVENKEELKHVAGRQFITSFNRYLEAEMVVSVVCGAPIQRARQALTGLLVNLNAAVSGQDSKHAERLHGNVGSRCDDFVKACREELRVE